MHDKLPFAWYFKDQFGVMLREGKDENEFLCLVWGLMSIFITRFTNYLVGEWIEFP
jgi:hypothetical protein